MSLSVSKGNRYKEYDPPLIEALCEIFNVFKAKSDSCYKMSSFILLLSLIMSCIELLFFSSIKFYY